MPKIDTSKYKKQLKQYIANKGVQTYENGKLIRCIAPGHEDNHPSAVLYDENVYCPICATSWDIFEVAGLVENIDTFPEQIKAVQTALGDYTEERSEKKEKKTPIAVPLSVEKAREIFYEEDFLQKAKVYHFGTKIGGVWPYKDDNGNIIIVDVRFEDDKNKKIVLSFYYDGKSIRWKGTPISIYNRDLLKANPDLPVLIVEGAKSAKIGMVLKKFVLITWNGGGKKAKLADWSILKNREVFMYPDDDQKKDKRDKKLLPWHKQPGFIAAKDIKEKIPHLKIIQPVKEARAKKADGADIVEALQVCEVEFLTKHILTSKPVEFPKVEKPKNNQMEIHYPPVDSIPFKILGTADDGKTYFLDRHGRLMMLSLTTLTKTQLTTLVQLTWWRNEFASRGKKVDWEDAIDYVQEIAGKIDFKPDNIRGRGAWREKGNQICYHDGEDTYGEVNKKRLYLKKIKVDIGINEAPAEKEACQKIFQCASRLSFETEADLIRCISWSVLAPFAGALPWRPAGLLTGDSGWGKTSVVDLLIRPLALPETFSGGETTVPGIMQSRKYDVGGVVIEEAETDTMKKKQRRDDQLSLMRMSTSDDTPKAAKGTIDGRGINYHLRDMFLFVAISPEIESAADENRIFRIQMKKPKNDYKEWQEIKKNLEQSLNTKSANRVRSLVWKKLKKIVSLASFISPVIQTLSQKNTRYSFSEGILMATFIIIWLGREKISYSEAKDILKDYYEQQPPDEEIDETDTLIQRLFDESIIVQIDRHERKPFSIREMLYAIMNNMYSKADDSDSDSFLPAAELKILKQTLGRLGLAVTKDNEVAFCANHHEIMKIIQKSKGYQRHFYRHKDMVEKARPVVILGKTKRCVIIKNLIEVKHESRPEE